MKVLIAGANGKIGQRPVRQMAESEHEARALIRDPAQVRHLQDLGAETAVADLEGDCSEMVAGEKPVQKAVAEL